MLKKRTKSKQTDKPAKKAKTRKPTKKEKLVVPVTIHPAQLLKGFKSVLDKALSDGKKHTHTHSCRQIDLQGVSTGSQTQTESMPYFL